MYGCHWSLSNESFAADVASFFGGCFVVRIVLVSFMVDVLPPRSFLFSSECFATEAVSLLFAADAGPIPSPFLADFFGNPRVTYTSRTLFIFNEKCASWYGRENKIR